MTNKYSAEFKEKAVKRVLAGEPAAKVARDLGINVNSLYTWRFRYEEHLEQPFVGSGHLRDEDAEIRRLQKEIRDLKEENEFLKKQVPSLRSEVARYMYIEANRSEHQVAKMAQWLNISKRGYYAWRKRYPSLRDIENQRLLDEIPRIHEEYRHIYGSHKITEELKKHMCKPGNHKRVERIMKENGIRSKVTRKYKATTNSRHNLPVAPNILNREIRAE